jgi:hypothetical protein
MPSVEQLDDLMAVRTVRFDGVTSLPTVRQRPPVTGDASGLNCRYVSAPHRATA